MIDHHSCHRGSRAAGGESRHPARLESVRARLALEGQHPDFGAVTLRQLLATWVVHDLGHLAQTARVMAKQYREVVGPWRVYLPILDR